MNNQTKIKKKNNIRTYITNRTKKYMKTIRKEWHTLIQAYKKEEDTTDKQNNHWQ